MADGYGYNSHHDIRAPSDAVTARQSYYLSQHHFGAEHQNDYTFGTTNFESRGNAGMEPRSIDVNIPELYHPRRRPYSITPPLATNRDDHHHRRSSPEVQTLVPQDVRYPLPVYHYDIWWLWLPLPALTLPRLESYIGAEFPDVGCFVPGSSLERSQQHTSDFGVWVNVPVESLGRLLSWIFEDGSDSYEDENYRLHHKGVKVSPKDVSLLASQGSQHSALFTDLSRSKGAYRALYWEYLRGKSFDTYTFREDWLLKAVLMRGLQLTHMRRCLTVLAARWTHLRHRITTAGNEQHDNCKRSGSDASSSLSKTSSGTTSKQTKRIHSSLQRYGPDDRGDNESDDDAPREGKKVKLQALDPKNIHRLACLFYKFNPAGSTNRACGGPGWPMKGLKEHLKRVHKQPQFCQSCLSTFETEDELSQHLRVPKEDRCEFVDGVKPSGVSVKQFEVFASRRFSNGCSDEVEIWFKMWAELFPEAERPSHPYYEPKGVEQYEELVRYHVHQEAALPDIILERIELNIPDLRKSRDLQAAIRKSVRESLDLVAQTYDARFQIQVRNARRPNPRKLARETPTNGIPSNLNVSELCNRIMGDVVGAQHEEMDAFDLFAPPLQDCSNLFGSIGDQLNSISVEALNPAFNYANELFPAIPTHQAVYVPLD